jgi:hypothetical protein
VGIWHGPVDANRGSVGAILCGIEGDVRFSRYPIERPSIGSIRRCVEASVGASLDIDATLLVDSDSPEVGTTVEPRIPSSIARTTVDARGRSAVATTKGKRARRQ